MNAVLCERLFDARAKEFIARPEQLSDLELLSLFISADQSPDSHLDTAGAMMKKIGNLRDILQADYQSFLSIPKLNIRSYLQLQAAREISRRADFIKLKRQCKITNTAETACFLKRRLRDRKNEVVAAIFLDSQHRVISYAELFQGSINAATVYTRPIIEKVLSYNAAALILAHNHPSGESQASAHDIRITQRIEKALALVEAKLLDHLVIGDNEIYSIMNRRTEACH